MFEGRTYPRFSGHADIGHSSRARKFDKNELTLPNKKYLFEVLDGQHRFVALQNLLKKNKSRFDITVPTIIMDSLRDEDMAALFVMINSKQTRIPTSLYFELAPRMKDYENLVQELKWIIPAHDYLKPLALESNSPLYQKVKITGEEKGWVSLSALGAEFKQLVAEMAKAPSSWSSIKPYLGNFLVQYFKVIAEEVFPHAWNNHDYSIKTADRASILLESLAKSHT